MKPLFFEIVPDHFNLDDLKDIVEYRRQWYSWFDESIEFFISNDNESPFNAAVEKKRQWASYFTK